MNESPYCPITLLELGTVSVSDLAILTKCSDCHSLDVRSAPKGLISQSLATMLAMIRDDGIIMW